MGTVFGMGVVIEILQPLLTQEKEEEGMGMEVGIRGWSAKRWQLVLLEFG